IPASYRRGDIEVLIAQQRLNVAVTEQVHAARIAFYTAVHHESLHALGEQERARLENNVRAQNDRYRAGQAERGALILAQLAEQELRPRLEESQRASSGASLQLARLMGDDLGPHAKLPDADGTLQFSTVNSGTDSDGRTALEDRADLKLARLLVRAANEDQRIIEAAYLPAITGEISGNYIPVSDIRNGSQGSARRSDDIISSELRGGALFTWRVVDNGKVGGAVARQRAVREINEATLAKLEASVPRDLARVQNNLRALESRYVALNKATAAAQQTVNEVQNNLLQGLASPLEYRSAETSYLETQTGLLTAVYEENVALAERDRVTGRYFQFSDDTAGKVH
ncbi:MAG: TolC family protein, partial [Verrucomicrobiota bacterium]|nr:TolC family protein [Verrucomicrobiota bacterium]